MPSEAPRTLDRCLSPGQLARFLGVNSAKVLTWIHSGRLAAINVATDALGRPRWRVTPQALQEFLAGRQATPPAKVKRTRKPKREPGWVDYVG